MAATRSLHRGILIAGATASLLHALGEAAHQFASIISHDIPLTFRKTQLSLILTSLQHSYSTRVTLHPQRFRLEMLLNQLLSSVVPVEAQYDFMYVLRLNGRRNEARIFQRAHSDIDVAQYQ
jgi:hypothetical protein